MIRTLFAACITTLAASSAVTAPCDLTSELATQFGSHKYLGVNLTTSPVQKIDEDNDIRSIRVLLKPLSTSSGKWTLTIRDRAGRPLQNISSQQIVDDKPFWSERLPTNFLEFHVEPAGPAPLRGVEYVALSNKAKRPYYSVQDNTPAWKNLYTGTSVPLWLQRQGDSIGMFVTHEGNAIQGVAIWTCSGFVIANDPVVLFVTNDHCGGNWKLSTDRWAPSVCPNAWVDFSWDDDAVSREYACKEVMARSPENDLVVLRLEALKPEAPPPPLAIRSTKLIGETVFVIHHPAGMGKQASISCFAMTSGVSTFATVDLTRDFAHRCDTERGSSGAPVLDSSGQVVGIHHEGFEKLPGEQCDFLSKAVQVTKLTDLLATKPELTGYRKE